MSDLYGEAYDNADDAAVAATQALEQQPSYKNSEYATLLIRDQNGKIRRTRFSTSNQAGKAPITDLFNELEPGQTPIGVVHNHPGGSNAKFSPTFLSDNDTAIGKGVKYKNGQTSGPLAMYLLAQNQTRLGTGEQHKTMGTDFTPYNLQSTNPVLAQFPIEELLQYMARKDPLTRAYLTRRATNQNPMTAALGAGQ